MRYFFIDPREAVGSAATIRGPDANHIKNVLRLQPGDEIRLFDGTGFEYEARITHLSSSRVDVSILGGFASSAESPVEIIIAQAFLKEKKMDGLVRRLSELGVTRWIPFFPIDRFPGRIQNASPDARSVGKKLRGNPSNSAGEVELWKSRIPFPLKRY